MKILFLHHKCQAFYISFTIFIPLVFFIFDSNNLFKIEFQNENTFSLSMKQFIQEHPNPIISHNTQAKKSEFNPKVKKSNEKINKQKLNNTQINPMQEFPASTFQTRKSAKGIQNTDIKPTQISYNKDNLFILDEIQNIIAEQARKNYPKQARKMRIQGVVKIEFLWKENQSLAELKIIRSSGFSLLDKSALESIRKASIFFPSYESDLRIVLPIVYNLN